MDRDTITLSLDGEVSLEHFRTAIHSLCELVTLLTEQAIPDAKVEWIVSDLRAGSATVAIRGEPASEEAAAAVADVVESMDEIGRNAAQRSYEVWTGYPRAIREHVSTMFGMLNGRVPRAKLGNWVIEEPVAVDPPETPARPSVRERLALRGKIVTLDNKRGTYFTLKEAFTDRLIRCWPEPRFRDQLAEYWKTGVWVLVEGYYNTFTNKPTLTEISEIMPLGKAESGGWRRAFGISPRGPGDSKKSVPDLVRKVRDGG